MNGTMASCAESDVGARGTQVTPFISMELVVLDVALDGVGEGDLDVLSVDTAMFALTVLVLFAEMELLLLPVVFSARSFAHAARCARRASSRVWPAYFPPGEMQNSAVWPVLWQCVQVVRSLLSRSRRSEERRVGKEC